MLSIFCWRMAETTNASAQNSMPDKRKCMILCAKLVNHKPAPMRCSGFCGTFRKARSG